MGEQLPDHVDVGPFRYTITSDELTRHRAQEVAQTIILGETDHDRLTIILNETMQPGLARETLMHECLHVVTEVCGLRRKWGNAKDERIIRRLSPLLLELLRRNPDIVSYLMGEDE
jgi:hypothetical protein